MTSANLTVAYGIYYDEQLHQDDDNTVDSGGLHKYSNDLSKCISSIHWAKVVRYIECLLKTSQQQFFLYGRII